MLRTDIVAPPTFHLIWSSSFSTTGNRPLTHNTMASQANHDRVFQRARPAGLKTRRAKP